MDEVLLRRGLVAGPERLLARVDRKAGDHRLGWTDGELWLGASAEDHRNEIETIDRVAILVIGVLKGWWR